MKTGLEQNLVIEGALFTDWYGQQCTGLAFRRMHGLNQVSENWKDE